MSSTERMHFQNDAPRLYFHMPPVTPPERLTALTFDNTGEIEMHSPQLDNPSPPLDSDSEPDPADLTCPSPPHSSSDESLGGDTPSPPGSSPTLSDGYLRDFPSMSPPSPMNALELVLPPSVGIQGEAGVDNPQTSPAPPAPPPHLTGSSDLPISQPTSAPDGPLSHPWSNPDLDLPTPSPPSSPSPGPLQFGIQSEAGVDNPQISPTPPAPPPHLPGPSDLLISQLTPAPDGPLSHPWSNPDLDFPTPSPPSSPSASPLQSQHREDTHDAISVASASPGSSFQWTEIPDSVKHHFLIPYGRSVIDLINISFQPATICKNPCCQPRLIMADAFLDSESAVAIMRTIPIPCLSGIESTVQSWRPRRVYNAVELRHNGGTFRFSPWALTAWRSFASIHDSINIWKKAVEHLQSQSDTDSLNILATIRWNAVCPIPEVSLDSIARLATLQWLNDESVSVLIYMVNLDLSNTTSRIMSAFASNGIRTAWQDFKRDPTVKTRKWIRQMNEDFREGRLHRLGLTLNVMAGGGPNAQGNHWIGIVIDAHTSTIYIGDSLDNPPHSEVVAMIKWFVHRSFNHDFTIRNPKISTQPVSWSCGDYAVNMVAHNLLPQIYPLAGPDPDDPIRHRSHLFHAAFAKVQELVCFPMAFSYGLT
jgi:Ulp1 protease family, C-terminal catalytic domain